MIDGGWWRIDDFSVAKGDTSSTDDRHRLSPAELKTIREKANHFKNFTDLQPSKVFSSTITFSFELSITISRFSQP